MNTEELEILVCYIKTKFDRYKWIWGRPDGAGTYFYKTPNEIEIRKEFLALYSYVTPPRKNRRTSCGRITLNRRSDVYMDIQLNDRYIARYYIVRDEFSFMFPRKIYDRNKRKKEFPNVLEVLI